MSEKNLRLDKLAEIKSFLANTDNSKFDGNFLKILAFAREVREFDLSSVIKLTVDEWHDLASKSLDISIARSGLLYAQELKSRYLESPTSLINVNNDDIAKFHQLNSIITLGKLNLADGSPPTCCLTKAEFQQISNHFNKIL